MPFPILFFGAGVSANAFQSGVVMLEAEVGEDGRPADVRGALGAAIRRDLSRGAAGLDVPRRPRRRRAVRGYAYVIFGFSAPVTGTVRIDGANVRS
jgi:hypothetical protein